MNSNTIVLNQAQFAELLSMSTVLRRADTLTLRSGPNGSVRVDLASNDEYPTSTITIYEDGRSTRQAHA